MPSKLTSAVSGLKETIRKRPLMWLILSLLVMAAGIAALYFLIPEFIAYTKKCFSGGCE